MDGLSSVVETPTTHTKWTKRTCQIAWALVVLGIALRVTFLAQNRDFWQDEIAVALAFEQGGNSASATQQALQQNNQIAPVGFLFSVKACSMLLGDSEWCFRLIPCLASAIALILTRQLAVACLTPIAGLFAIGIVGLSPRLLDYSSELKPYAVDQLIATAILYLAYRAYQANWSGRHLFALAAFGVIAPWFSFPSTFVLAIVGAALFVVAVRNKQWQTVTMAIPMGILWVASFGIEYKLVKSVATSEYMLYFWHNKFMPFPPQSLADLAWIPNALSDLFKNPLKTSVPYLAMALCLVGWIRYWKRDRMITVWLIGPVLLTMAVSAAHIYPFADRVVQFMIPALAFGMALGLEWVLTSRTRWQANVGIALALVCLAEPTAWSAKHAAIGREREAGQRVLQYMTDNWQPGDVVYRSRYSDYSIRYYAPRVGLPTTDWVSGENAHFDKDPAVAQTVGNNRVWFYFGHAQKRDVQSFVNELDRRYKQIDAIRCEGSSSAYLYDMRPQTAVVPDAVIPDNGVVR